MSAESLTADLEVATEEWIALLGAAIDLVLRSSRATRGEAYRWVERRLGDLEPADQAAAQDLLTRALAERSRVVQLTADLAAAIASPPLARSLP